MSDFLTRLIDRTLGIGGVAQPVLQPLFADDRAVCDPGIPDLVNPEITAWPQSVEYSKRSIDAGPSPMSELGAVRMDFGTEPRDNRDTPRTVEPLGGVQPAGCHNPDRNGLAPERTVRGEAGASAAPALKSHPSPPARCLVVEEARNGPKATPLGKDDRLNLLPEGEPRTERRRAQKETDPGSASAARAILPEHIHVRTVSPADRALAGPWLDSPGSRQDREPEGSERRRDEIVSTGGDAICRPRSPEPPLVSVTIGRIDVRAAETPPAPRYQRSPTPQPTLSLQEYLRRSRGGRQ